MLIKVYLKASRLIYHRGPDSKKYFFSGDVNIFTLVLK